MENRRQFIKRLTGLFSGMTILSGFLPPFLKSLYGRESNALLAGGYMDKDSMKAVSSRHVTSRRVKVTPLRSFGLMGETGIKIVKDEWDLEINSKKENLLKYTYDEILRLPSFEKMEALECPGFFTNHGLWKGFSLGSILGENNLFEGTKEVEISGLNKKKITSFKFPIKSILNDHIFLAYGVNRETLPMRNGFPLRVVAHNYPGGYWIKYVNKVTLF